MAAPPFDTMLHRIGELQPRLPPAESLLLAVVALGTVVVPASWLLVRHVSVIAHEGAHAVTGSGLGHKVAGIRLQPDGTGATRVPQGIAVSVMGYFGPSLLGLGMAKIISVGHSVAVLWLALLALTLALPVLRGSFSFFVVIVTGMLVYAAARYAAVPAQTAAAYGITWFLLLSGIRVIIEHGRNARDARDLSGITHIPRGFWSALWLAGTGAALIAGGALLL